MTQTRRRSQELRLGFPPAFRAERRFCSLNARRAASFRARWRASLAPDVRWGVGPFFHRYCQVRWVAARLHLRGEMQIGKKSVTQNLCPLLKVSRQATRISKRFRDESKELALKHR